MFYHLFAVFFVFQVYHGQEVVPLLMLHGWPGSVREFYETIPYLTKPDRNRNFAVHVIAPSLPGFGFSDVIKLLVPHIYVEFKSFESNSVQA